MLKVNLQGIEETMLIPLWARAYETTSVEEPLLKDLLAVKMVGLIDYDFKKFMHAKYSQVGVAVRSAIFDREVKAFLRENPKTICISMGCGLDTRFNRVDNGSIHWYDIDLPEAMKVRNRLLSPVNERVHEITASIFDEAWVKQVKKDGYKVLFIVEGISMYFEKEQMQVLFSLLSRNFPESFMLIEVMPPFIIKHKKYHDSVDTQKTPFLWGVNDGRKMEELHSSIKFIKQWTLYEGYRRRWGIMGFLSLFPWWNRNCNDKVVYLSIKRDIL